MTELETSNDGKSSTKSAVTSSGGDEGAELTVGDDGKKGKDEEADSSGSDGNDYSRLHDRKKHRRGRKADKWRPYNKLSWEQKQELEERNAVRASRNLQRMVQQGKLPAPSNTTQFLMDEHRAAELGGGRGAGRGGTAASRGARVVVSPGRINNRKSADTSEECLSNSELADSSSDSETEFLTKDFSAAYEESRAERLQNMTKEELFQEVAQLEMRVTHTERLEERLKVAEAENRQLNIARDYREALQDIGQQHKSAASSGHLTGRVAKLELELEEERRRRKEAESRIFSATGAAINNVAERVPP